MDSARQSGSAYCSFRSLIQCSRLDLESRVWDWQKESLSLRLRVQWAVESGLRYPFGYLRFFVIFVTLFLKPERYRFRQCQLPVSSATV